MKITENLVVSLDYTLQVDQNGEKVIADKSQPGQPLAFIFGSGMLLPEFESNIVGKEVNDAFDFKISAEKRTLSYIHASVVLNEDRGAA